MAFQVIWSTRSQSQLQEIDDEIRADNPTVALRFLAGLIRRIDRLREFPRSAAVFRRRRGYEVRQISYRKYRIFYRVQPRLKRVEILSVWHGARQEPKIGGRDPSIDP